MKRMVAPVLVLGLVLAAAGCGPGEDPEANVPGRSRFVFHCSPCHGKDGLGSRHLFPPLAGESWVNDAPEIPIRIVLHGLEGRLVLEGEEYLNKMPGLGLTLDDARIAEILTYVRGAFGNTQGPVSAEEVARVRALTADRRRPYRVEEMQAVRDSVRAATGDTTDVR